MIINRNRISIKRHFLQLSMVFLIVLTLSGCSTENSDKNVKLDPKNPVVISVWHYYNGAIMNAFEAMVKDFNETVGAKEGIIVESYNQGSISELEKAVVAAAKQAVGSMEIPNIFASYADTAYEAEKMGILANLDDYFTEKEQIEYIDSYVEEGKIGLNGELRIFPIAKSTETFMLNETDWLPFANANGLAYDDLSTLEGLTRVSKLYYEWTDSQTPDIPNDGKAFYGRDSMANLFIIASKAFGVEIFHVKNGVASVNIDENVMRKIWDNYYLPYISGYFTAYGKYRSDDAKVGDILAYVGSTTSVSYFPNEVTDSIGIHPVTAKILPVPNFKDAQRVMVQQGAGMVVTKSTAKEEYASVVFLKWFTEIKNNVEFAVLSGYMPVKKEANQYESFISALTESGQLPKGLTNETLQAAFEQMETSELYTNKAFNGGAAARLILERSLQDKAAADREDVLSQLANGISLEQALSSFNTDENFLSWLNDMTAKLIEASN